MYGMPEIPDHDIIAVNRSNGENKSAAIIYKDKSNQLCTIDLKACAENYKREYEKSSGRCVGRRDITQWYFVLYTNDGKVIIRFEKTFLFNTFGKRLMSGTRSNRFHQLQDILLELGYTTYDLS